MSATKTKSETYGVVNLNYGQVVMPLEQATALMNCFANAERLDKDYGPNGYVRYVGGTLPELTLEILSGSDYAKAKMNGEKPK